MLKHLFHRAFRGLVILALAVSAAPLAAQESDLQLPISLDADFTDYDGKNSMLMFRGLRLSQGNIGVVADKGRASKLDFEDSVWQFSGNVRIDTGNGHIECETADLHFSGHRLQLATISGSPATFELQRPGSEKRTYAEAGHLEYDFSTGIIEFTEQATITEGGNQISSNYLLYNIREQRINAQSGGTGDDKVKITYTPATSDTAADGESASAPEESPDNGNDEGGAP